MKLQILVVYLVGFVTISSFQNCGKVDFQSTDSGHFLAKYDTTGQTTTTNTGTVLPTDPTTPPPATVPGTVTPIPNPPVPGSTTPSSTPVVITPPPGTTTPPTGSVPVADADPTVPGAKKCVNKSDDDDNDQDSKMGTVKGGDHDDSDDEDGKCGSEGKDDDDKDVDNDKNMTGLNYICILDGPGKAVHLGYTDSSLVTDSTAVDSVCMSKLACTTLVSTKFKVQEAAFRGFCKNANHAIQLTDSQVSTILAAP